MAEPKRPPHGSSLLPSNSTIDDPEEYDDDDEECEHEAIDDESDLPDSVIIGLWTENFDPDACDGELGTMIVDKISDDWGWCIDGISS